MVIQHKEKIFMQSVWVDVNVIRDRSKRLKQEKCFVTCEEISNWENSCAVIKGC